MTRAAASRFVALCSLLCACDAPMVDGSMMSDSDAGTSSDASRSARSDGSSARSDGAVPMSDDAATAADGSTTSGNDDQPFATARAACTYGAGALPSDTFGASVTAAQIPIDTFVLVMHENRSFDHYFSHLPAYGQPDVDVASPTATIPGGTGTPVARFHESTLCVADTAHGWNAMHHDWDGGQNDGFAITNADSTDPTGVRTLGYYTEADLPFYYAFASTFATSDRYFCPTLTSTGPNRLYFYAATSNGSITNNGSAGIPVSATIFGLMDAAGVTWKVYSSGTYSFEGSIFSSLPTMFPSRFGSMSDYRADAAAGKLPNVVYLYTGSDEHPPADPQKAQKDVAAAYQALASSPQWPRSAFLLTYDENGGLYDHVAPPPACAPDGKPPALTSGDVAGDFAQYGFRVPIVVASPWARAHYVSHVTNDHTSILRLLELRFGLPALTARDANANALLDLFDFTQPTFATPPSLPTATIDSSRSC